ncbi:MAG: chemotaxis protein CheB [Terriglobia bacterium]
MKKQRRKPEARQSARSTLHAAAAPARASRRKPSSRSKNQNRPFPIVGIGASAGGLEAIGKMLEHVPAKTGMAFVLVQHLTPQHKSMLTPLLAAKSKLTVAEVVEGMKVEPDHVYVIPPNTAMKIAGGVLRLMPREQAESGAYLPVDRFFESLARERGPAAIGVILSGTASDGTKGMLAIKAAGGITFAQDEASAKYPGMPQSAIASGAVDIILPPEGIAAKLLQICEHPYIREAPASADAEPSKDGIEDFKKIFAMLRGATGVDFNAYKLTTINRRIKRRMALHKLQKLPDYVKLLAEQPEELHALFRDILIHVTGFFRNEECFEALSERIFPRLTRGRANNDRLRIWVPACSTGEEVYSLAMCWTEFQHRNNLHASLQIFGTDISEIALQKARAGIFGETIRDEVGAARLLRFFTKTDRGYQINRAVRDLCVFSRQNALQDPPFRRLDLISCRNLLIYLEASAQKRLVPLFHYALKPDGILVLGGSEGIGAFSELFTLVDKKNRIYLRQPGKAVVPLPQPEIERLPEVPETAKEGYAGGRRMALRREFERILLNRLAMAGVTVDQDLRVIELHGHTGLYLEWAPGEPSFYLPRLARDSLAPHLNAAIREASRQNAPVQRSGIEVKLMGHPRRISFEVIPFKGEDRERYFFILFREEAHAAGPAVLADVPPAQPAPGKKRSAGALFDENTQLRQDLHGAHAELRSLTEQGQAVDEEVRAYNEELLSANEELQSVNEELETTKEELQSGNEELATLNDELQNRNSELTTAHSYMHNLLANISVPVLILSQDLRIRHFTPQAAKLLNLLETDIGRPLSDLRTKVELPDLAPLVRDVTAHGGIAERNVQAAKGHQYSMRVFPYLDMEGKVTGVVVTWIDVDALRHSFPEVAAAQLDEVRRLTARGGRGFAEDLAPGFCRSTMDGEIQDCNHAFAQILGYKAPGELKKRNITELYADPGRRAQILSRLKEHGSINGLEIRFRQANGEPLDVLMNLRLEREDGQPDVIVKMMIDSATRHQQAEMALSQLSARLLELRDEARKGISQELHDTVGPYLTALVANLASIRSPAGKLDKRSGANLAESLDLAKRCLREIRTISYLLYPPLLDEGGLASALRWYVNGFRKRSNIKTRLNISNGLGGRLPRDVENTLFRIVQEGLTNIYLHSGSDTARIALRREGGKIVLEISDKGRGFPPGLLVGKSPAPLASGVGIASMRERIKRLDGELEIKTGKQGSTLCAIVPAAGHAQSGHNEKADAHSDRG